LASEASTVKTPYLVLGLIITVIAVIFAFLKLPEIVEEEDERQHSVTDNAFVRAFKHTHLNWAIVAQFFYVGAQVCVFSFFILYATEAAGIDRQTAAWYAGFGVGLAFMVGRFVGTFLMKFYKPSNLLAIYSIISVVLCIVAMTVSGILAVYTVIGIAFFMSIMFPTIFSLGIKDLGSDTKFGSSLIIMSIVGGAILPPIMGYIADMSSIQTGYIVPMICFGVVFFFGFRGHRISKKV